MANYHIITIASDGHTVRHDTRKRLDAAHFQAWAHVYEAADHQALRDRPVAWNALKHLKAFDGNCSRSYDIGSDTIIIGRA